jgi:hypothetical protein
LDELIPYVGRRARSILTLSWGYDGRSFLTVPVFANLIATIQLRQAESEADSGCTHVSWTPAYELGAYSELTYEAWEALTRLTDGRLVSGGAKDLADKLRVEKHANPMIGIVCAYLYDLVGDSESLLRLCYYYVKHGQPIPFDIALLSGGEMRVSDESDGWEVAFDKTDVDMDRAAAGMPEYLWTSTPAGWGRVAGATPLVRAGWSRLAARGNDILREFAELEGMLARTPVSTLVSRGSRERALSLLRKLKFFRH